MNNDIKIYKDRVRDFHKLVSPPPKKNDLEWIIPAKLHPATATVLATMEAVSGFYELYPMLTDPILKIRVKIEYYPDASR